MTHQLSEFCAFLVLAGPGIIITDSGSFIDSADEYQDRMEAIRQDDYSFFSDMYKMHNGIRPRFAATYSISELREALVQLDEFAALPQEPRNPTSGEGWTFTYAR